MRDLSPSLPVRAVVGFDSVWPSGSGRSETCVGAESPLHALSATTVAALANNFKVLFLVPTANIIRAGELASLARLQVLPNTFPGSSSYE